MAMIAVTATASAAPSLPLLWDAMGLLVLPEWVAVSFTVASYALRWSSRRAISGARLTGRAHAL
jgi:hypothetical protein